MINPEEDTHTPEPEKCDCDGGYVIDEFDMRVICTVCRGEGYVYPTDTQREDYYEQKMEERRL